MKILGIDPGYALVGWAIIETEFRPNDIEFIECGVISTSEKLEFNQRLQEIYTDINHLIDEFKPEYCGMETLLFQNNAKTAMKVSEARGVLNLAFINANLPVKDVTPLQVKNSITGYGKADKRQVQESVKMICNLEEIPKPDDAADAVAVAISAVDFIKNERLIKQ